jgi:hypothetical protein
MREESHELGALISMLRLGDDEIPSSDIDCRPLLQKIRSLKICTQAWFELENFVDCKPHHLQICSQNSWMFEVHSLEQFHLRTLMKQCAIP